jgi:predicted aspartyl protease
LTTAVKIASSIIILTFLILSSCVLSRKKNLEKKLENVDPDPKTYTFTLKTKITDILSVKAQIGGRPGTRNFMFDTGSPLTYSFKTKDSFNIISKKLFRLGSNKFDYGSGSIKVGTVTFNNAGFLVTDYVLSDYGEVDGIIGSSILQTSICEINFVDSTIRISNDLENFTNIQNTYSCSFEPSESQGTPIVKITIGKDTITAFIDTGFSGTLKLNNNVKIPPSAAEKQEVYCNLKYFGVAKSDNIIRMNYYQPKRLSISNINLDSMIIGQDQKYKGRNLIGLSFLKKFIVTIDWIHHRIYFKPIESLRLKKNVHTYGFTCKVYDGQLRIFHVYSGSEIEKAGIKSGDVILAINNSKEFSDTIISSINSHDPGSDSIQILLKNNFALHLKKNKLFN